MSTSSTSTSTTTSTTPPTISVRPSQDDTSLTALAEFCSPCQAELMSFVPPWTCHDYMTIALWDEHYISLKILNEKWDECVSPSTARWLQQRLAEKHKPGYLRRVWRTRTDTNCYNLDLWTTQKCPRCWLIKMAKSVGAAVTYYAISQTGYRRKRHTRKDASECHIPSDI